MASQLRDMGVLMDETAVMTKILITLPPSYRHFMSVWDNVPDELKTVELLTTRLLKEETINSTYGSPEVSNTALLTRNPNFFSTKKTHKWAEHICEHCHKKGHSITVCWRKKEEDKILLKKSQTLNPSLLSSVSRSHYWQTDAPQTGS